MDTITNIPVSSLTYALKGQKVLERYGYKAWQAATITASAGAAIN